MKTNKITKDELEGIEAVFRQYFMEDCELELY